MIAMYGECWLIDYMYQLVSVLRFIFFMMIMQLVSNYSSHTWALQSDPELAQAIVGNDLNNLQQILRERHRQRSVLQRQQEEEMVS